MNSTEAHAIPVIQLRKSRFRGDRLRMLLARPDGQEDVALDVRFHPRQYDPDSEFNSQLQVWLEAGHRIVVMDLSELKRLGAYHLAFCVGTFHSLKRQNVDLICSVTAEAQIAGGRPGLAIREIYPTYASCRDAVAQAIARNQAKT